MKRAKNASHQIKSTSRIENNTSPDLRVCVCACLCGGVSKVQVCVGVRVCLWRRAYVRVVQPFAPSHNGNNTSPELRVPLRHTNTLWSSVIACECFPKTEYH